MVTTSYPDSVYSHTPEVDGVSEIEAEDVNRIGREAAAVTVELGTLPKGLLYGSVKDLLTALLRQLEPAQQTTPDLTLQVAAGRVYVDGNTLIDFAGGNSPSFTAPSTNPRIDLLVLNSSGTLERVAGSEAASPSPPTYPSGKIVICQVYNRVGQTSVKNTDDSTNGYIHKDVRPFLNLGVATGGTTAMPSGHVNGLEINRSGSDSHDLDIAAGAARSDDDSTDIVLSAAITKQMDAAFAEGDNVGGRQGALSAGMWNAFLITGSGKSPDVFFAQSASPTPPTGFDKKRFIGSFYADGSGVIRVFKQVGSGRERLYQWTGDNYGIKELTNGSAGTLTIVSLANSVSNKAVEAFGVFGSRDTTGTCVLGSNGSFETIAAGGGGDSQTAWDSMRAGLSHFSIVLETAQTIYYRNVAGSGMDVNITGYRELL